MFWTRLSPRMVFLRGTLCAGTAVLLLALLCFTSLAPVGALWLTIPSSGTKCVSEELHGNVVVMGDYHVVSDASESNPSPTITARVTSPYGNSLHQNHQVTSGQFAFTTTEAGAYLACFWVDGNHKQGANSTILDIDWGNGITARVWESVAKKGNAESVELELKKLEGLVNAIRANLLYLRSRESEMREVSEKTNSRVAWLGITSLGFCILTSIVQLWHLKHFFRQKKLI